MAGAASGRISLVYSALGVLLAGYSLVAVGCASNGTGPAETTAEERGSQRASASVGQTGDGERALSGASERGAGGGVEPAGGTGELQVSVSWLDAPAEARRPGGRTSCGIPYRAPVVIHTLGGVRDALVTVAALDTKNVPLGRAGSAVGAQKPAELLVTGCRVEPRVLLAGSSDSMAAAVIEISSLEEKRKRVRFEHRGVGAPAAHAPAEAAIDVDLPIAGVRASVRLPRAGIWVAYLDGESGDPAYVIAPGAGHHQLTDDKGLARFSGLQSGRYQVRVWHPTPPGGNRTKSNRTKSNRTKSNRTKSNQRGLTITREITVAAGSVAELSVPIGSAANGPS